MRKLGLLPLATSLIGVAVAATSSPAHAEQHDVTLGGVRVALHDHTRQVVTVDHTHGYHARIGYWVLRQGRWQPVYAVRDGRIGYGGLVAPRKRHQGTGTTPLGTTTLISAFGRHPRGDSWSLPYRRIKTGDYWVEDNGSRYYNRYRNKAQGGFRWWLPASNENGSERLRDFPVQYEFSIVTGYNHAQVRHRGAGIFLHVNGSGATAGCVSAPRSFLKRLMWRLDPAKVPVMAVGR
ncbi:MAG TPA: L,D-transpeptidase family protein [Nocardioides sp.]|jgi:L,D-peptidoglycan transpeptidase YkuD (ErfK/YbiS/YcfS/YnhG family)|nr:L,D-transpeptidase family protein [Nocardioides sp.]